MQALGIIAAILLFILLVVIHEFGHFITSKLLGVQVNEFSVGMGPLLWSKQKGETQYSVRALPIGGYCKLEGEDGAEDDEEDSDKQYKEPNPRAFYVQPAWKKVIILCAGAFMNFVLCLAILFIVFFSSGTYTTYLADVEAGGPADLAGIKAGDKVVAVNGIEVKSWDDVITDIGGSENAEIEISVERDGQLLSFTMVPILNEELGRKAVGITCLTKKDAGYAIRESFTECRMFYVSMADWLVGLFRGKASSDDVMGVVGIVSTVGETAQYGVIPVMYLMGIISLNLAFVNMLPFPALDGGRVLFVIIRAITKGRISDDLEATIHAIGMIILLGLMAFLIFRDTINLIR